MARSENCHFFPLTSLQIGDLQSYLSHLSLFLAPESNKFFILVDNRPWLMDQDSRPAHLWQLMVTKSRLSPFANTKAKRERKDFNRRPDLKHSYRSNPIKPKKFYRWFTVIDAALSRKKALLPVKKLRDSLILNSELHRTLYGFIVFEVAWINVRGINYLNELQTDTSLALETKVMRRWEFDSIEQASRRISSWFPGTSYERFLLQEYLDGTSGEVFFDAREDLSEIDSTEDCEKNDDEFLEDISPCSVSYPEGVDCRTSSLYTPPPISGPYKRRKIMKSSNVGSEVDRFSEEALGEIFSSPRHSVTSSSNSSSDNENATVVTEASHYTDVLILFRFNNPCLPFKLTQIIMSDLRLLTLLEYGLPSWVVFLQSYPVFCQFYRPWMCPLARALYVLISFVTVLIGFYDLYKNVPLLKATASRLCGPFFDWIENWEMISRIKYLGTMLFLHNFEKAVKWFLMTTRAIRSLLSVLTEPMTEPLVELMGYLLPFCNMCLQAGESISSVIGIAIGSACSILEDLAQILLWPMWFILSVTWTIATFILYPIFWVTWEILIAPIRLVLASASFTSFLFSYIFDLLSETWLLVSSIFQLASASEATVVSYEASVWRSLWNDLFSQVFRAIRSILYGFVAFCATCNRHRLSIYNHMQEFLIRLSHLSRSSRSTDFNHGRRKDGAQNPVEARRKLHGKDPQQEPGEAHWRRNQRGKEIGVG